MKLRQIENAWLTFALWLRTVPFKSLTLTWFFSKRFHRFIVMGQFYSLEKGTLVYRVACNSQCISFLILPASGPMWPSFFFPLLCFWLSFWWFPCITRILAPVGESHLFLWEIHWLFLHLEEMPLPKNFLSQIISNSTLPGTLLHLSWVFKTGIWLPA